MGFEIGSLAEMMGAIASAVGIILSILAMRIAREADRKAEAFEEQNILREKERDKKQELKDRRAIAGSLQAWWVMKPKTTSDSEPNNCDWGIVISNEGQGSTVFHDVIVTVIAPSTSKLVCKAETIPPGKYFCRNDQGFKFPEPLQPNKTVIPITSSSNHKVTQISFTDPVGIRWVWTPQRGLEQYSESQSPVA